MRKNSPGVRLYYEGCQKKQFSPKLSKMIKPDPESPFKRLEELSFIRILSIFRRLGTV